MKFYKETSSTKFKVGIFTLVAIIILILGYSWLSGVLDYRRFTPISVVFQHSGGIERGSTVNVLGVNRGRVRDITITPEGVFMNLLVQLDEPLYEGTEFIIRETNIMGNMDLEIIPGKGDNELDLSKTHRGETRPGISDLVEKAGFMFDYFYKLTDDISDDELLPKIIMLINDSADTVKLLNSMLSENRDELREILINTKELSDMMENIVIENRENISESVLMTNKILKELHDNLEVFVQTGKDLQIIARKAAHQDGSLNKLITEEELYDNLMRSAASLDSLLRDIKEDPKKYFQFKLF